MADQSEDPEAVASGSSGSESQPSSAAERTLVVDATDAVVATPEGAGAQPLERDPSVDRPLGATAEITPKDLKATVASGGDTDAATIRDRPESPGAPGSSGAAGAEAPAAANSDAGGERSSASSGDGSAAPASSASGAGSDGAAAGEAVAPRVSDRFAVRQHATDDEFVMEYEIGGPPPRAVPTATPDAGAIDRATVVFIHGWCGDRSQWRSHMEKLSAKSVVLSVDLLGHGASKAQEREEWTIPRYGRDVAGVIEAEDLKDVILVGHAMGGQVALEVALRLPDRIMGVIGVESLHELNVESGESVDDAGFKEYVAAFENDFMKAFNEFIESAAHPSTQEPVRASIREDAKGCSKPVAIKLMKHFQTRDLKKVVRNIECPVRCINSAIFKTDVEGNRALLTGFAATELPGVGYWPHLELPESFQSELVVQIKAILAPKKLQEPAAITGLWPVLFADDVDALATFYKERLAFKPTVRYPTDPEQPATLIMLERDDWRLQLQSRASIAADLPGAEDVATGGRQLFFTVTDLVTERERIGPGVKMTIALRTLESGSQQTVFRDPEKNVIILQQPARRTTAGKE